jgi:hypothetical protein
MNNVGTDSDGVKKIGSLSVYSGGHSVNVAFGAPLETFISSCGQECGAQEKESAVKATASASTA